MNVLHRRDRGFTLLEVLAMIGIAILIIIAIFGSNSIKIKEAQQCQAKLAALGPAEQQCLLEIAQHSDPCPQCAAYNAEIGKYNAGVCGKYGPVSPYVCPVPRPQ